MTKLEEAFADLAMEAEQLAREHWASTGNQPPQFNAMIATIWIRIRKIEETKK